VLDDRSVFRPSTFGFAFRDLHFTQIRIKHMKVFIVGATGGVGRRAAEHLLAKGHQVTATVRRTEQGKELTSAGICTTTLDVAKDSIAYFADTMRGNDVVLFTAGAGGRDTNDATTMVDGNGPGKLAAAMKIAGVKRFYLVSVFPEAWRERRMDDEFEHYMVEKKRAETQIVLTDLDWVILRPSALTDEAGIGSIDLGLAKVHEEVRRDDVAGTLIELMENPRIARVILEVTGGSTPIQAAVAALLPRD
jgi:nucleoside-diphosphate-sugar epimerase